MAVQRGLGRGFDSLIPTQIVEAEFDVTAEKPGAGGGDGIREIAVELVDPNPHQPRTNFPQEELQALAASIRVHGILQPLVATKQGSRFELIAGERRLRAAKIAGLATVPMIIRSFDEQQKLELALIENIQRQELNAIELATAYRKLVDQFNLSLADVSEKVSRSVPAISNTMRLLGLPIEAKRAIVDGLISEGHGRALLTLESDPEKQAHMLELILKNKWSTRQAEEFARGYRGRYGSKMKGQARISQTNAITNSLGDYLGTKVTQQRTAKGGKLIIEYYGDEELDRIIKAIQSDF
jgi:ParB family transcriptional regulator, chromosome partitioning protein